MPSFLAGAFALAGAVLTLGPVLIHLLDRQRYRRIQWGAMELLRDAEAQTRRLLRLRDLLLLALRCGCVLLFGLALARPFFSGTGRTIDSRQPVHAVVVVDNSLSMGYGELRGTLLDEARARVEELLDRLPEGSRVSIIPLCGSTGATDPEAYRSIADAREALARIEVADRVGTVLEAIDLAREASRRVADPSSKRIFFVGDQQQVAWPSAGLEAALGDLAELQVVPVVAREPANAWIENVRLQDDIADTQNPSVLTATVRYEGPVARSGVRVGLEVDGAPVASRIVDLVPGQARDVEFTHRFVATEAPAESYVPVAISLSPDRLPADDFRFLAVPVVAALPIVFVDQYGAAESPQRDRLGETYHLRRLLAPASGRQGATPQAGGVKHVTVDQLDRQLLREARLVVIAGVESPGATVPLLREFVEQGGQLLIAAGGRFSPLAWSDAGWLDGAGILPAPLSADFVGRAPDEAAIPLEPFFLSPATMSAEFFDVAGADRTELDDLYRTPVFFRTVVAHPEVLPATRPHDVPADRTSPHWLQWRMEGQAASNAPVSTEPDAGDKPRVLASFSNGHPFLIERHIGSGTVVFAASSVGSNWNNLPRTNAILLLDRLLRHLLARTLPRRNFEAFEQVSFPIRDEDRRAEIRLERPDGPPESIPVDALGPERFGVVLRHLSRRGAYRLVAERGSSASRPTERDQQRLWEIPLAVNGPPRESDLAAIDEATLRQRVGGANVHWIGSGEALRLEGADVRGQDLWRWLLGGVLAALLCEMLCLALVRPAVRQDFRSERARERTPLEETLSKA